MVGEEIELEHVFAHRPEEFVVKPSVSWKPPSTIEADLHFMPVSESAKAEFRSEEIELEHVFAHRPEEFVVKPSVSWKPPSTIEADLHFMPVSESAKAEFGLPFLFTNPLDAFSKTNIREQLHRSYFSRYDHITDRQSPWFSFLYESYKSVTKEIADLNKLFDPPFRFVPRDQFETVDLKRILNEPPEQTEIYLVAERRTYSSYDFLRIHSSLWYYHNGKKYLWFEKRLPDFVLKEDVLPWLRATIQRMPK